MLYVWGVFPAASLLDINVTFTAGHWSPSVYDLDLLSRGMLQWIRGWETISDHTQHAILSLMYTKTPTSFQEVDSERKGSTEYETRTSIRIGLVKDMEQTNAIK